VCCGPKGSVIPPMRAPLEIDDFPYLLTAMIIVISYLAPSSMYLHCVGTVQVPRMVVQIMTFLGRTSRFSDPRMRHKQGASG
jgi:hypothetical protein